MVDPSADANTTLLLLHVLLIHSLTNTNRNEKLLADPVRLRQISERIPAGRWGEPRDFAGPVVFLASAASQYVCGELLVVDGVSSFVLPFPPLLRFPFLCPIAVRSARPDIGLHLPPYRSPGAEWTSGCCGAGTRSLAARYCSGFLCDGVC